MELVSCFISTVCGLLVFSVESLISWMFFDALVVVLFGVGYVISCVVTWF